MVTGTHYHCPNECEHPQPFTHEGKRYCGRCWVLGDKLVEVILCTPETCDD
jgi:hypothetical protein